MFIRIKYINVIFIYEINIFFSSLLNVFLFLHYHRIEKLWNDDTFFMNLRSRTVITIMINLDYDERLKTDLKVED